MTRKLVSILLGSLLAAGCTSTAIYSDSIGEFDKAFASARDVIKTKDGAMNDVKRRKQVEATFYDDEVLPTGIDDPKLMNFVAMVCASSDYLGNQRNAISTLAQYDSVLDQINERPKDDLAAIAASISANLKAPDTLTAVAAKPKTTKDCATEVTNLVTLRRDTVPEFAFLALATSAIAVVDAAQQVAIDAGHILDDAIRGARMTQYVKASQSEVDKALALLNAEDPGVKLLCQKLTIAFGPPCRGSDAVYTRLDGVAIAEKWAALRDPWHLYLSMYEVEGPLKAGASAGVNPKAINSYFVAMDKYQDDLGAALVPYRTLLANPTAGDIGRAMRQAQSTLVDIANGKISPQQGYAVLKQLASELEAVSKDLKALRKADSDFVATIGK